jgi:opacity protein-like surface antigen
LKAISTGAALAAARPTFARSAAPCLWQYQGCDAGLPWANTGWTLGTGLEVANGGGWTAKAEYLFIDLGSASCGFNCGGLANDNVTFRTSIVRGGLNYRF